MVPVKGPEMDWWSPGFWKDNDPSFTRYGFYEDVWSMKCLLQFFQILRLGPAPTAPPPPTASCRGVGHLSTINVHLGELQRRNQISSNTRRNWTNLKNMFADMFNSTNRRFPSIILSSVLAKTSTSIIIGPRTKNMSHQSQRLPSLQRPRQSLTKSNIIQLNVTHQPMRLSRFVKGIALTRPSPKWRLCANLRIRKPEICLMSEQVNQSSTALPQETTNDMVF